MLIALRFVFFKIILFLPKFFSIQSFKSSLTHFFTVSKINTYLYLKKLQNLQKLNLSLRHFVGTVQNKFFSLNLNSIDRGELSLQHLPHKNFSLTIWELK